MTTKPAVYMARSRARLADKGGRVVQVSLRKGESDALALFREARGFETDTDAVRAAIVEAARRAKLHPKG